MSASILRYGAVEFSMRVTVSYTYSDPGLNDLAALAIHGKHARLPCCYISNQGVPNSRCAHPIARRSINIKTFPDINPNATISVLVEMFF